MTTKVFVISLFVLFPLVAGAINLTNRGTPTPSKNIVPGGTSASPSLQRATLKLIMELDLVVTDVVAMDLVATEVECDRRKVIDTEVISVNTDGHTATERWTLDRCGKIVNYLIDYTPTGLWNQFKIGVRYHYKTELSDDTPTEWPPLY